jgi:hypothetical protein
LFLRRDDLAGHAQFGEVPEARLPVIPEVTDGLVEAEHPFLDQVIGVPADQEVGRSLHPDEALIALDELVGRIGTTLLRQNYEVYILRLRSSFSVCRGFRAGLL